MTNRFVALGLIGTAYHVVLGVFALRELLQVQGGGPLTIHAWMWMIAALAIYQVLAAIIHALMYRFCRPSNWTEGEHNFVTLLTGRLLTTQFVLSMMQLALAVGVFRYYTHAERDTFDDYRYDYKGNYASDDRMFVYFNNLMLVTLLSSVAAFVATLHLVMNKSLWGNCCRGMMSSPDYTPTPDTEITSLIPQYGETGSHFPGHHTGMSKRATGGGAHWGHSGRNA